MRAPLKIRPVQATELERVQEIEDASFGAEAYDRKLFAEYYHAKGVFFLVAEKSGAIWGYLLGHVRGKRVELVSLAVHPARRRERIATALLRRGLKSAPPEAERFTLMVRPDNPGAEALYAPFGFRRVRRVRGYYEDGSDGLLMTLRLRENQAGTLVFGKRR